MIRRAFEKAGNFFGYIEDKIRDARYNTVSSKKARTEKAADILEFYVNAISDVEANDEILLKRMQAFVPSGHYFIIGEIYSGKNKKTGVGELIEYNWRERAIIDRKLPQGDQEILASVNKEIIGEKKRTIIPKEKFYDTAKAYFHDQIDIIMISELRQGH